MARDSGKSLQQALETFAEKNPSASVARTALLKEAADLLFKRFRNMPAEQVAFEFAAACLDDAQ